MREQMLKLAGAIGDGLVLSAGLSAGYVKASLDLAAAGGPDGVLDPVRFNRAGYLYFLVAADEADARRKLRHKLAFVLRNKFLDDNVRHSGLPIDQAGIIDAIARRDVDAAAALVPEEAIDAFGIVGDVEKCRRRLREYLDAGLAEPVLSMTGDQADRRRSLAAVAAMMQTL
jgi:alkanesulfonate monooxygenase SsuD/methylene tetrahydromethanopterin reductase-like flavin-dependent oxidoreductase (luciferase family)